ncbi:Spore maturation protein CgeB [Desulfonatronum thiosulfatophilum]|uniref:Spore maturation protein CgeB n=1 Tax=Desulfonatronum thiosulfatophilum TaxID=617002 RepID=A0A1G6BCK4_9BACT|nr:glycosyltransferase [Desulfonatronum thiosulfatophilum]SDB18316.1 Spore maturation protein CgeB [Desulfonatronum thiosulfatophilum]
MKISMFYHSLISDWNHGNAHFLRGFASELVRRGHDVSVYEPENNWSLRNLLQTAGEEAVAEFNRYFPSLRSNFYDPDNLEPEKILEGQDLVIVHEWNELSVVNAIGRHKASGGKYILLFHDTHHRSITDHEGIGGYDLSAYDGVLAFGDVIRDKYLANGWAKHAWTWHEAADTAIFYPRAKVPPSGDLVWIGNWGDEERTRELFEFLIEPVRELNLKAKVYGVRYPEHALQALSDAGIEYGGWLPNYKVPEIFARYRVTVHVPRRPYVDALPGIPTIRPFEALACGIPLVCSPWQDTEHLFAPGEDHLVALNKEEMKMRLSRILDDDVFSAALAANGLQTVRSRHSCSHRVDELFAILDQLES